MKRMTMATICSGAVQEKVDRALRAVADNILDPNTDARKKRSITLKITFVPNEDDREDITVLVDVAKSLAPDAGVKTQLFVEMPMDRKRYPPDWKRIATEVKEAADWKCQRCGKQCRRPGEPFDTHKRTLTVAHLNHTPEDVRPENLQAMCAPCHLRYDAQHHAETRRNRKKIGAKEYADYGRCLMEGLKAGLQSEE